MSAPETSFDRGALLAFIDADAGLAGLLARIRADADGDASHDVGHVLRVALWTVRIAGDTVPRREAVAAALLHDLVNVPKDSPDRARASELCAEAAVPLLRDAGFDEAAVARMHDAIRDHSFSRGAVPTGPLGRALQDADRLEALGAIGILRTAATGQRMGARFFDDDDPFAEERELNDRAFSVDHFYTKLLGLPATMLTAAGRAEGERRVTVLRRFLDALGDELGVAPPGSP